MRLSLVFFGFAGCLFSCQSSDKKKPSLEPFADSLVRLNPYSLRSIDSAAGYYTRLVSADSLFADSATVMLLRHVEAVADTVNRTLYADTADYSELVYNENKTASESQKEFGRNLAAHHLILQGNGEGDVYAVPDYDWLLPLLQQKTSASVDGYLSLMAAEEKKPALLDAGFAIEMKELVDRLLKAEQLSSARLPGRFAGDVQEKSKFYTGVLLLGSDNTPALEYDRLELTPEFKNGYVYLLQQAPASKAAQRVKEWMKIIKAKDQKKMDEWREKYATY